MLSLAALRAGSNPDTIPIITEKVVEKKAKSVDRITGTPSPENISDISESAEANPSPNNKPMSPPINPMIPASVMNKNMMSNCLAPIAFMIPISRVLS